MKIEENSPFDVEIRESFLTRHPCYTAGRKIQVKGLMLHSVGCPQPSAECFVASWNREDFRRACVHAFIDAHSGIVYQTLPWDHFGWHGASGPRGSVNATHIGVEMCESEFLKYVNGSTVECSNLEKTREMAQRTYDSAVRLFAYLCQMYDLDPLGDGVIISHTEANQMQIASAHCDPEHLWTQLEMGFTMDGFRKDVSERLKSCRGVMQRSK